MQKGKIIQIIGPVVDVEFSDLPAQAGKSKLPAIYNALKIKSEGREITLEGVKHLDKQKVRAISLQSTDGLKRGDEAVDTGDQILVPVGSEVLGNLFNVVGETLEKTEIKFKKF